MTPSTISDYIAAFPPDLRRTLTDIRRTIAKAAPDSIEVISYRMPAFKLHGRMLVYFAAWKEHVGLYPPPPASLTKACARYAGPKGNLQFPLNEPMPLGLIARIVKARAAEIAAKKSEKKSTNR